jgi:hypothetical protein
MARVGIETTISVFEPTKTVDVLNITAAFIVNLKDTYIT